MGVDLLGHHGSGHYEQRISTEIRAGLAISSIKVPGAMDESGDFNDIGGQTAYETVSIDEFHAGHWSRELGDDSTHSAVVSRVLVPPRTCPRTRRAPSRKSHAMYSRTSCR
jgi:hypothetical protein